MTRKTNASAGSKWRSFKASKGTFSKNCGCGNAVLGWQFWSRLFPIFQNSIPPSNLQNVLISLCAQSQTKINIMAIPDIWLFFHPLPYFRHSVTNWFCSRQIHDSHTHMLSQFIPAWMLLQSILREEEHKKMASNAVSIKGCSYSSMIHWFVGKRVNLFSASLIIDLRRFFRQNERSQILTLLPRQRISSKTEKDKQINKHWNTHSQQQGSGRFLIKTVEKFLFKREKDVDSRLVSLALEITLTQVHTAVVHRLLATSDEQRRALCSSRTRRAKIQNWES